MIKKIISGGQTGVDRAALDFAFYMNINVGGYCPKGRRAEDGVIDAKYPLIEIDSYDYSDRTEKNLMVSDGTLILYCDTITGGTALTLELCELNNKPNFIVNLNEIKSDSSDKFIKWIKRFNIRVLNIAGSREKNNFIYEKTILFLKMLFKK